MLIFVCSLFRETHVNFLFPFVKITMFRCYFSSSNQTDVENFSKDFTQHNTISHTHVMSQLIATSLTFLSGIVRDEWDALDDQHPSPSALLSSRFLVPLVATSSLFTAITPRTSTTYNTTPNSNRERGALLPMTRQVLNFFKTWCPTFKYATTISFVFVDTRSDDDGKDVDDNDDDAFVLSLLQNYFLYTRRIIFYFACHPHRVVSSTTATAVAGAPTTTLLPSCFAFIMNSMPMLEDIDGFDLLPKEWVALLKKHPNEKLWGNAALSMTSPIIISRASDDGARRRRRWQADLLRAKVVPVAWKRIMQCKTEAKHALVQLIELLQYACDEISDCAEELLSGGDFGSDSDAATSSDIDSDEDSRQLGSTDPECVINRQLVTVLDEMQWLIFQTRVTRRTSTSSWTQRVCSPFAVRRAAISFVSNVVEGSRERALLFLNPKCSSSSSSSSSSLLSVMLDLIDQRDWDCMKELFDALHNVLASLSDSEAMHHPAHKILFETTTMMMTTTTVDGAAAAETDSSSNYRYYFQNEHNPRINARRLESSTTSTSSSVNAKKKNLVQVLCSYFREYDEFLLHEEHSSLSYVDGGSGKTKRRFSSLTNALYVADEIASNWKLEATRLYFSDDEGQPPLLPSSYCLITTMMDFCRRLLFANDKTITTTTTATTTPKKQSRFFDEELSPHVAFADWKHEALMSTVGTLCYFSTFFPPDCNFDGSVIDERVQDEEEEEEGCFSEEDQEEERDEEAKTKRRAREVYCVKQAIDLGIFDLAGDVIVTLIANNIRLVHDVLENKNVNEIERIFTLLLSGLWKRSDDAAATSANSVDDANNYSDSDKRECQALTNAIKVLNFLVVCFDKALDRQLQQHDEHDEHDDDDELATGNDGEGRHDDDDHCDDDEFVTRFFTVKRHDVLDALVKLRTFCAKCCQKCGTRNRPHTNRSLPATTAAAGGAGAKSRGTSESAAEVTQLFMIGTGRLSGFLSRLNEYR